MELAEEDLRLVQRFFPLDSRSSSTPMPSRWRSRPPRKETSTIFSVLQNHEDGDPIAAQGIVALGMMFAVFSISRRFRGFLLWSRMTS